MGTTRHAALCSFVICALVIAVDGCASIDPSCRLLTTAQVAAVVHRSVVEVPFGPQGLPSLALPPISMPYGQSGCAYVPTDSIPTPWPGQEPYAPAPMLSVVVEDVPPQSFQASSWQGVDTGVTRIDGVGDEAYFYYVGDPTPSLYFRKGTSFYAVFVAMGGKAKESERRLAADALRQLSESP
jgi:hypothetical protein